MSFYTVIKTELCNKKHLLCALAAMNKQGEISGFVKNAAKESIQVDRSGDIVTLNLTKTGNYEAAGDNRVIRQVVDRIKQYYALETIKENLPLDFEIVQESETAGEITILLKG